MTIVSPVGYTLPGGDQPLTHARILHSRNWLSGGTVSVSSTDADYFADAPNNTLTYEKWKPATTGAETWEYDHGSAVECDCCCIAAHDFGSQAVTVSIQYWNGSTWVDLVPSFVPSDDGAIMAIFNPTTAQRWRVGVQTSSSDPGRVAVIKFGKALQMERPIYGGHAPLDFGRVSSNRVNRSETGEFLGITKQFSNLVTSFEWQNVTASWVRSNLGDLQRATESDAIFIAWRPESFEEVGFGLVSKPPSASNLGIRDLMAVGLSMNGYAHD